MSAITFACFVLGGLPLPSIPYCNPSYCPVGQTNVGCNPPTSSTMDGTACEGFTPSVIVMDETMQKEVLNQINHYRYEFIRDKPAVRMPTVTWDAELAELAAINARVCNGNRDECSNTAVYRYVGQNILRRTGNTKANLTNLLNLAIWIWNNARSDDDYEIDSFPLDPTINQLTAYALLVDKMDKLGCAVHEWKAPGFESYFTKLVCNFSVRPVSGQPVYVKGQSATQCLTGTNPNYPLLCSESEVIDPVPHGV